MDSRQARHLIENAMETAVKRVALSIQGEAQRLAPVEEGTLRASAQTDVERRGDTVTATISFSTPYAARQHEELHWHHPMGGHAKYLETPLKAKSRDLRKAIQWEVDKVTRGR